MRPFLSQSYSRYVSLMKVVLPIGILLSIGFAVGWPYIITSDKEEITFIDLSQPEIRENRMVRPHYLSTDTKGQPFHVDADWAKEQAENIANLVNPEGSMAMTGGQTLNLKAREGHYNKETRILDLKGEVTLISTDGYHIKTDQANVTIDDKVIEGNSYIEGEGPTGRIMGQKGFKIESCPKGLKILTLKGPSHVTIYKSFSKKKSNAQ